MTDGEPMSLSSDIDCLYISSTQVETSCTVRLGVAVARDIEPDSKSLVLLVGLCLNLDTSEASVGGLLGAIADIGNTLGQDDELCLIAPPFIIEALEHSDMPVYPQLQLLPFNSAAWGAELDSIIDRANNMFRERPKDHIEQVLLYFDSIDTVDLTIFDRVSALARTGVVFDAVGVGEGFDYGMLQELATPTGGITDQLTRAGDIRFSLLRNIERYLRTAYESVQLKLTFVPLVQPGQVYQVEPRAAYLGTVHLVENTPAITMSLGHLEGQTEYTYLVTCTLPRRPAGQIRVIKAELSIHNGTGYSESSDIVVTYTDDPLKYRLYDSSIGRMKAEAEISRLVEDLAWAINRQEPRRVSLLFDILSRRYLDFGLTQLADEYIDLKRSFLREGYLSRRILNDIRHRAVMKMAFAKEFG